VKQRQTSTGTDLPKSKIENPKSKIFGGRFGNNHAGTGFPVLGERL
jgi:hypothetical protein